MYGKIFATIFDGSLYGRFEATATLMVLITLANRHGEVDMTIEALSARTGFPIAILQAGIEELSKPDPRSRTPGEDGKRIVPIAPHRDWGWRLVNYETYRTLRTEDDRREYHAQYYRDKRSAGARKARSHSTTSTAINATLNSPQQHSTNSTHAKAEVEVDVALSANQLQRAEADAGSTTPRATRFGVNSLPSDWKDDCRRLRPDLDPQDTFDTFSDFWRAKAGRDGTKLDWRATWRNWCRTERSPPPGNDSASVKRLMASIADDPRFRDVQ